MAIIEEDKKATSGWGSTCRLHFLRSCLTWAESCGSMDLKGFFTDDLEGLWTMLMAAEAIETRHAVSALHREMREAGEIVRYIQDGLPLPGVRRDDIEPSPEYVTSPPSD